MEGSIGNKSSSATHGAMQNGMRESLALLLDTLTESYAVQGWTITDRDTSGFQLGIKFSLPEMGANISDRNTAKETPSAAYYDSLEDVAGNKPESHSSACSDVIEENDEIDEIEWGDADAISIDTMEDIIGASGLPELKNGDKGDSDQQSTYSTYSHLDFAVTYTVELLLPELMNSRESVCENNCKTVVDLMVKAELDMEGDSSTDDENELRLEGSFEIEDIESDDFLLRNLIQLECNNDDKYSWFASDTGGDNVLSTRKTRKDFPKHNRKNRTEEIKQAEKLVADPDYPDFILRCDNHKENLAELLEQESVDIPASCPLDDSPQAWQAIAYSDRHSIEDDRDITTEVDRGKGTESDGSEGHDLETTDICKASSNESICVSVNESPLCRSTMEIQRHIVDITAMHTPKPGVSMKQKMGPNASCKDVTFSFESICDAGQGCGFSLPGSPCAGQRVGKLFRTEISRSLDDFRHIQMQKVEEKHTTAESQLSKSMGNLETILWGYSTDKPAASSARLSGGLSHSRSSSSEEYHTVESSDDTFDWEFYNKISTKRKLDKALAAERHDKLQNQNETVPKNDLNDIIAISEDSRCELKRFKNLNAAMDGIDSKLSTLDLGVNELYRRSVKDMVGELEHLTVDSDLKRSPLHVSEH